MTAESIVGVLVSVEDYVKENPDRYEDIEDFVDTFMEQSDPKFQASLRRAARDVKRGRYLTLSQLKTALRNKKLA